MKITLTQFTPFHLPIHQKNDSSYSQLSQKVKRVKSKPNDLENFNQLLKISTQVEGKAYSINCSPFSPDSPNSLFKREKKTVKGPMKFVFLDLPNKWDHL